MKKKEKTNATYPQWTLIRKKDNIASDRNVASAKGCPVRDTKPEDVKLADQYAGKDCTLDDQPAKITGRLLRFAVIMSKTQRVEFAWSTVHHVMTKNNGKFKS